MSGPSTVPEFTMTENHNVRLPSAARRPTRRRLRSGGYSPITTEIIPAGTFFYAEDYHQQYLAKNPSGYCGLGGTGVALDSSDGISA